MANGPSGWAGVRAVLGGDAVNVELPLSTVENGIRWYLHAIEFKTADGTFGAHVYAVSDEHACAIVAELRETAVWKGRIEGVVE